MRKDLLTVENLTDTDLENILKLSELMKRERLTWKRKSLDGKTIALIFSKSSTRTRVSFEVGIRELGGNALFLDQNDMQLGRGETIEDTAKVLSRYIHGVVIRTYKHDDVVELAKFAKFPVINALTDEFHPCQILTDLFTMREFSGKLKGVKVAFLGDCASNMANSMILAANLSGLELRLASPEKYAPSPSLMKMAEESEKGEVSWTDDITSAVEGVDYIYTDVWVSMGMEDEKEKRLKELKDYKVTNEIVEAAGEGVRIMHCLPAHRGEEITSEVIGSHKSIVFDQAENRLHVQKSIMTMLLDEDWKDILEEG
ncbi:MAG: ornithine carbamoyltransferase [Kiritimatiellaeota bacterium]|nr:ornithine carbamoyltransferase [Kiritimatiellota bacterium]